MKKFAMVAALAAAILTISSCKKHEPDKPKLPKFDHMELVLKYTYTQDILDLFDIEAKVTLNGSSVKTEKLTKTSGTFEAKDKIGVGKLECNLVASPKKDKFVADKEYDFSRSVDLTLNGYNDDKSGNGYAHSAQSLTVKGVSFKPEQKDEFIDTFTKGLSNSWTYNISNKGGTITLD